MSATLFLILGLLMAGQAAVAATATLVVMAIAATLPVNQVRTQAIVEPTPDRATPILAVTVTATAAPIATLVVMAMAAATAAEAGQTKGDSKNGLAPLNRGPARAQR